MEGIVYGNIAVSAVQDQLKNSKKPDDHHQVAGLQRFMQGGLRYRWGHTTALRLLLGCLLPAQRVELSVPRRTGKTLQIHRHRPRGGTTPRTAGHSKGHTRHLPLQLGQRAQDLPRLQPIHHTALPRLRHSKRRRQNQPRRLHPAERPLRSVPIHTELPSEERARMSG